MPSETRYFRNAQSTVNGLTCYELGTTQTTTSTYFSVTRDGATCYIGIRVYKRTSAGVQTEITAGTPVAQVNSTLGTGLMSNTWSCPETSLNTTDSIVVQLWMKDRYGTWNNMGSFQTEQLGATKLNAATWTIYYYQEVLLYYLRFWFGSSDYNSHIENFTYTTAVAWTKSVTQPVSVLSLPIKQPSRPMSQSVSISVSYLKVAQYRREFLQQTTASMFPTKAQSKLAVQSVVASLYLGKKVESLRIQPVVTVLTLTKVLTFVREYSQLIGVSTILFKQPAKTTTQPVSVTNLLLPKQMEALGTQPIEVLSLLTSLSQYQRVFTQPVSVPTSLFKASQIPKTQPATVLSQVFKDVQVPKTQPVTVAITPATLSQFIRFFSQPVSVFTTPTSILELIKLLTQPIGVVSISFKDVAKTQFQSILVEPFLFRTSSKSLTQTATVTSLPLKDVAKPLSQLTTVIDIKTIVAQYQRVKTQPITVLATPTTVLQLIRALTQPITVVATPSWVKELVRILSQSVSVDTVLAKAIRKYATEIVKPCVIEMVYVPELGRYILIIDSEIGFLA